MSVANYLRSLLGWPQEQQGSRKDLNAREAASSDKAGTTRDFQAPA